MEKGFSERSDNMLSSMANVYVMGGKEVPFISEENFIDGCYDASKLGYIDIGKIDGKGAIATLTGKGVEKVEQILSENNITL